MQLSKARNWQINGFQNALTTTVYLGPEHWHSLVLPKQCICGALLPPPLFLTTEFPPCSGSIWIRRCDFKQTLHFATLPFYSATLYNYYHLYFTRQMLMQVAISDIYSCSTPLGITVTVTLVVIDCNAGESGKSSAQFLRRFYVELSSCQMKLKQ